MAKGNKHIEVKPSKFKTTLCQYYMVSQECPYGARCVFAHGEADLHTEEANVELLKTTGLQRLDGFFGAVHGDGGLGSVHGNNNNNSSSSGGVGCGGGDVVTAATSPSGLTSTPTSAQDDVLVTLIQQQQQQQQQQPQSPLLRSVRRRPIMVSLPKHTTSNEAYSSPYIDDDVHTAVSLYHGGAVGGVCSHHAQHAHDGGNGNTTATSVAHAAAAAADTSSMAATATSAAQLRCSCAFASSCQQERPIVYRHNPYSIY